MACIYPTSDQVVSVVSSLLCSMLLDATWPSRVAAAALTNACIHSVLAIIWNLGNLADMQGADLGSCLAHTTWA